MIEWLLDVSNFPARANCCVNGPWPPWFQWFYAVSEAMIALAYFVNPLLLRWAFRRFVDSKHFTIPATVVFSYAVFIFCCGAGHLLSGVMPFFWPNYHLIAAWNYLTAAVSWVANAALASFIVLLGATLNEIANGGHRG